MVGWTSTAEIHPADSALKKVIEVVIYIYLWKEKHKISYLILRSWPILLPPTTICLYLEVDWMLEMHVYYCQGSILSNISGNLDGLPR